jgi:UrcA family protein
MLKMSLIAAALCAAAAPALAQELDADILQRTVSYADLDLSSPAGVAAFDRRIDTAVTEVCGHLDHYDLKAQRAILNCRHDARSKIEVTRNALVTSAQAQKGAKAVVLAAK